MHVKMGMAIISFGFKKISIARDKPASGKVNVNHSARIDNVEEAKFSVGAGAKQDALRVAFTFTAEYAPEIANINLQGELLWVDKPEQVKSSLDMWSKSKSLPTETLVPIYNTVLQRSIMQSFLLTKEMNLPPPIRLPRLKPETPA